MRFSRVVAPLGRMLANLLALALCAGGAFGQYANVHGKLTDASGNVLTTGFMRFELENCGENFPLIAGVNTTVVQTTVDMKPNQPDGSIIGRIIGNDQILCGNIASTYWQVTLMKDADTPLSPLPGMHYFICASPSCYPFGGYFDPSTAMALNDPPAKPGFVYLFGNPTNSQTWAQPGGTTATFTGTFDFSKATILGFAGSSWGNITGSLQNQTDLWNTLAGKEDTANKNVANGYAGLDSGALISPFLLGIGNPDSTTCLTGAQTWVTCGSGGGGGGGLADPGSNGVVFRSATNVTRPAVLGDFTALGVAPTGSPSFTGTMTMPDSSTWNSSGLNLGAAFGLVATTPATSGGNISSPLFTLQGNYWNGSASVLDKWTATEETLPTNGGTGTRSVLLWNHNGASGNSGGANYTWAISGDNSVNGCIQDDTGGFSSFTANCFAIGAANQTGTGGDLTIFNTAVSGSGRTRIAQRSQSTGFMHVFATDPRNANAAEWGQQACLSTTCYPYTFFTGASTNTPALYLGGNAWQGSSGAAIGIGINPSSGTNKSINFYGPVTLSDGTQLLTDLAATEKTANKGVASGYAGLNSSGLVPTSQLGTGTANSSTCLSGAQTYVACGGGGGGTGFPPAGVPQSTGSAWGTSLQVGTAAGNLLALDSSANLTLPGNITINGIINLGTPFEVQSSVPSTAMIIASPGTSKVGFDSDGKLKVSENAGAVTEVAKVTGNIATATKLAAAPTPCGVGMAANGVDQFGNATGCLTVGDITSVTAGTGLTGGGTTGAVTVNIANTGVGAGSCTNCALTYNPQGQITAAASGSGGGGAGSGAGGGASISFTAQTTVTIPGTTHLIGSKNLLVQCYDNASPADSIQPASYTVNGTTFDVTVNFSSSQSGYCVVSGLGPAKYSAAFTSLTTETVTGATHGLGRPDLSVTIWDNSSPRNRIEPASVTVNPTTFDVTATFAAAQSGTIVIQ